MTSQIDSPLGALFAAATPAGLVRLAHERGRGELLAEDLARTLGPVREDGRRLDALRRQLDAYFSGRLREFDLPVDWSLAPRGFRRRALEATARVPHGETASYAEIAAAAGNPRAARAAGSACANNPIAIVIPCHRVVRSDATIGNYGWGPDGKSHKEFLLRLERGSGLSLPHGNVAKKDLTP